MRARCLTTVAVIAVAAGTLAACSSGPTRAANGSPTTTAARTAPSTAPTTHPTTGGPTATSPATTGTAPAACALAPGYTPGTTKQQLTVDGEAREYLVHLPPHPTASMRLVVDFHGANSNMQQQDIYSGFDALADQQGFVVATPNGITAAIRQWRFLGTSHDVDFATAIVHDLAAHACVDAGHAYAVGISSGSAMSASLACQASDTFAGFGLVAADFYYPPLCDRARPRPMIIFHGTADPVVPYYGGSVATGQGLGVRPEEESAAAWAEHDGCEPGPVSATLGSQVVRLTWKGCAAPVVLYRIVGGGHTWPGAVIQVERLGLTTTQISATKEMWAFFSAGS